MLVLAVSSSTYCSQDVIDTVGYRTAFCLGLLIKLYVIAN